MKKVTYIRCPRCELNYITKADKFCSVCKQEMQVGGGEDFDELDLELCPICKTNYIQPDEVMCSSCLAERSSDPNYDGERDEWDKYINRDDEEENADTQDEEIGEMSSVKMLGIDDDDDLDSGLDIDDDDLDGLSLDDEEEKDDSKDEDDYDDDDDDFDDYDDDDFDDDDDDDDDE